MRNRASIYDTKKWLNKIESHLNGTVFRFKELPDELKILKYLQKALADGLIKKKNRERTNVVWNIQTEELKQYVRRR